MTQEERLNYLIHYLLNEDKQYRDFFIPSNELDKKKLLRSLMNVRPPKKISQDFLKIQDLYLQEELQKKEHYINRKSHSYKSTNICMERRYYTSRS